MSQNKLSVPQWLAVQVRVDSTRKKHAEFFRDNRSRTHHAITTYGEDFLAAFPQSERADAGAIASEHRSFISAAKLSNCGRAVQRLIYPAEFYPSDFYSLGAYGASETQSRDAYDGGLDLENRRSRSGFYYSWDKFLVKRALLLNPGQMQREFLELRDHFEAMKPKEVA